jgi:hypothetical protein
MKKIITLYCVRGYGKVAVQKHSLHYVFNVPDDLLNLISTDLTCCVSGEGGQVVVGSYIEDYLKDPNSNSVLCGFLSETMKAIKKTGKDVGDVWFCGH